METRTLLKISLVIALISIFILAILAINIEPSIRKIDSINEKSLDEWVKIQGKVTQQRDYETLRIITINDGTASINCVVRFNIVDLKNKTVEVLGKVIDYKGNFEIDVSRLIILQN